MSEPAPGTCELCKHWDEGALRKAKEWREKYTDTKVVYESGKCRDIRAKVEIDCRGDGYVESVETDADFGCILFTPLEDAT